MALRRARRLRVRARRGPTIHALIPNALTVLGLCLGLTAIRFAFQGRWELAVAAIIAAGVVDGLDGRIARILKASTVFGAELDSLSDFLCFGVAPALLLHLWALDGMGGLGWAVALLFAVCIALRLARFNASLAIPDRPAWMSYFFTGMPAPSAGGIALIPMMLSFELGDGFWTSPAYVAAHTVATALLAISTVPIYSGKVIKLRSEHVLPALILVGLVFAAIISSPWYTFSALGVAFVASIPFSIRSHRRFRQRALSAEAGETAAPPGADGP